MGSYRQTLLYDLPTLVTLLACETRAHSWDLMPSTCSLGREESEKRAPTGVHDGFREMVIFHHMADLKVFYHYMLIALGIRFGCFEMMITPLTMNLEMRLDLEQVSQLLGDNEMLLVLMHRDIFAILPKTDRVPPVWCFETRKADTRKSVLFGGKKALEGLGETISEHLYSGSGNVLMS